MQESITTIPPWDLTQIPYATIDLAQARIREDLFYVVAGASFVEIAADLYTSNLAQFFEGDDEVVSWLKNHWQREEVGHGYALRGYVQHVWPEFDWQRAFSAFYDEYSPLCTVEEFESTRCLEMVARCVVETGTATFYQALSRQASEPVLAGIAACIRAQEVAHYKYFFKCFRTYNELERPGRLRIIGALRRRALEARHSDAECALRHVFTVRRPDDSHDKVQFKALCRKLGRQIRRDYPVAMATKMFLKPLQLPASVSRLVQGPLARASMWLLR